MSLVDPNQLNDCVNEAKCHNYEIVYKTHFKLFFCLFFEMSQNVQRIIEFLFSCV